MGSVIKKKFQSTNPMSVLVCCTLHNRLSYLFDSTKEHSLRVEMTGLNMVLTMGCLVGKGIKLILGP